MVVRVIQILILILIILYMMIWLITSHIKSATSAKIREQMEKEYQEKHRRLESEFAEKEATLKNEVAEKEAALAKRERVVALQEHKLKSVDDRVRFALQTLQVAEEKERDVERREQLLAEAVDSKFAQRERELARREHNLEVIIARKVEEGIKGREKGLTADWRNFFRESSRFKEDKEKMYKKAVLISAYLGIPLKCILTRSEKKLVDQLANELTEEHYALIDLVMSCPDDQAKDLLKWMQRFPQSLQR